MTKVELMHMCWKKTYGWEDLRVIGAYHRVKDIPTKQEYIDFCGDADDHKRNYIDQYE